jgi:protein O-GlcNAc transferase
MNINALIDCYQRGDLDGAEHIALALLERAPDDAFAWKALGAIRQQRGRLEEALPAMLRAAELGPNDPEAHTNLGVLQRTLGDLVAAEQSHRRAIDLRPEFAEARSNLGMTLRDLKRYIEAEREFREALRYKPGAPQMLVNLGNTLADLGRSVEAEAAHREAISQVPDYANAHNNLGVTLRQQGRFVEAEMSYRRALALRPDYAEAHNNLGVVLRDLGRFGDAETACREAMRLGDIGPDALANLAAILQERGDLNGAIACYRDCLRQKPDLDTARSNMLFCLNYVEQLAPDEALQEALAFGRQFASRWRFERWNCGAADLKLRIGFVSGDLRNHPVGYFLEGLITHIDRARFELFAYVTQPREDDLTKRIRPAFAKWHSIVGMSDEQAARLIHADAPHILIDLSGHTEHGRLPVFAHRPAPLQLAWLGYFATTGLSTIDYVLGDAHVIPLGEEHHFSEAVWRLPETYLSFTPPADAPQVGPLPARSNGYVTFGCFNHLTKMNASVIRTWSKILSQLDSAQLFLKARQLADPGIADDVRARFAAHGISANRLRLEGPSDRPTYFKSYGEIDIALDPFPYPGGTTSAEALWMGVPILSLRGRRFISHNAETIAHNSGQTAWIAQSEDDYVALAIGYARDLDRLALLRHRLRSQISALPLFDTSRFTRHFEQAMETLWQQHWPSVTVQSAG